MCDALSFLINEYEEMSKWTNCLSISKKYNDVIKSNLFNNIVLLACDFRKLASWEFCVDVFDLKVETNNLEIIISDNDDEVLKSISAGQIKLSNQRFFRALEPLFKHYNVEKEINMYREIGIENCKSTITDKGSIFTFDYKRAACFKSEFLKGNDLQSALGLLSNEQHDVEMLCNDYHMTWEELKKLKVTNNCDIYDVLLFKRFFFVLYEGFTKKIIKNKNDEKTAKSLLLSLSLNELIDTIELFIRDKEKIMELIKLFTYVKNGGLQYSPLISNGTFLLSPSLIAGSNLLSNSISISRKKGFQDANNNLVDHLSQKCFAEFSAKTQYKVFENYKIEFEDIQYEIDLIVISDTDILLIECKNSKMPNDFYEMRTSYDHLCKAESQLSKSKKLFENTNYINGFYVKEKIKNSNRNVITCIVSGNRLFNGYEIGKSPVRYIDELINVLACGTIRKGVYSAGETIWYEECVWKNSTYSHDELLSFLSKEHRFIKEVNDQLKNKHETICIDDFIIKFNQYEI